MAFSDIKLEKLSVKSKFKYKSIKYVILLFHNRCSLKAFYCNMKTWQ